MKRARQVNLAYIKTAPFQNHFQRIWPMTCHVRSSQRKSQLVSVNSFITVLKYRVLSFPLQVIHISFRRESTQTAKNKKKFLVSTSMIINQEVDLHSLDTWVEEAQKNIANQWQLIVHKADHFQSQTYNQGFDILNAKPQQNLHSSMFVPNGVIL